ncbi:MAG TPA: putative lipid II flippase FtsW [Pleomorphomonadaceae bacterium]|nr:putative lipid II flippase FtsW [Pleomorphomonadaceae bacterium]
MTAAVRVAAPSRRAVRTRGVQRERRRVAMPVLVAVLALVAIGVVMVYSASSVRALLSSNDPARYGIAQAVFAAIGLSAMVVMSRIDFRVYRYFAIPAYVGALVLLALVLVPTIGFEVGGSRRWLQLPVIGNFQPAEVAKLAIILYLAHWLDRRGRAAHGLRGGLIPFALLVAPGFLLIAAEPDLGTAGIYVVAAMSVFFMSGASMVGFVAMAGAVVAAAVVFISRTPYQLARVTTFLDPERDPLGAGYNAMQALMALAMGGLAGVGLGASRQKYLYLPAPSTDFIYAIIGEEWGLIGTLIVLVLFLVIAWQGYRIAVHAPDTFSGLLAAGITTWLVVQAVINMMVVTALWPITGIPLPFISYGGTALIINLVAVGILLSISREAQTGSVFDALRDLRRRDRRAHLPRVGRRAGPARAATRG